MGLSFTDITDAVGLTSKGAEGALRQQERDARGLQRLNREEEEAARLAFEEDKTRGLRQLRTSRDFAKENIRAGRVGSELALEGGQRDAISSLLLGGGAARGDIQAGTQGAIGALGPARLGTFFAPQVARSSTLQGFGQNISDILSGGALDPLIGQRQESATSALASAGLSRSNVAAERAAEIPAELAFLLEGELFGRAEDRLTTGLDAQSDIARLLEQQGINLGNIDLGVGQGVSGIQEAGGINLANLIGGEKTSLANLITGSGINIAELLRSQPGALTPLGQTSDPVALQQITGQRDRNIAQALGGAVTGGVGGGGLSGAGKGFLSALF